MNRRCPGEMSVLSRVFPLLIGGLATALAVAKTGRPVHVLEKAPEFAELGAGLQLAPNAVRVLNALGLLDEIEKHAFHPRRLILMDMLSGEEITALELGLRFLERYQFPYLVAPRRPAQRRSGRLPRQPSSRSRTTRKSPASKTSAAAPASRVPTGRFTNAARSSAPTACGPPSARISAPMAPRFVRNSSRIAGRRPSRRFRPTPGSTA
jgi:hypothetical protein